MMYLLHARTKIIEAFSEDDVPPYAILSHTWGRNEITFEEIQRYRYTVISTKVDGCCRQAIEDGLEYVWIDTCCIDKRSSAELSEAINSMWSWYQAAKACYVYMSDVTKGASIEDEDSGFGRSRWFTRGWTLQELLAPSKIRFYDKSWQLLGRKSSGPPPYPLEDIAFMKIISKITGIRAEVLSRSVWIHHCSVAEKMSWAALRKTTRTEDVAYSLLGIFDVNMPMLYGEGKRAFRRLQEEILKSSSDESILAWGFSQAPPGSHSPFATRPSEFVYGGNLVPRNPPGVQSSHYSLTNKGLYIEMSIFDLSIGRGSAIGRLNCTSQKEEGSKSIGLALIKSINQDNVYWRSAACAPVFITSDLFAQCARTYIYLQTLESGYVNICSCGFRIFSGLFGEDARFQTVEFYPPEWRSILTSPFVRTKRENIKMPHQKLMFLCQDREDWPKFVVQVDCTFERDGDFIRPQEIKCSASFVEEGNSLAESMMRKQQGMEDGLDWQERLNYGGYELKFDLSKPDFEDPSIPISQKRDWILYIDIDKKDTESQTKPLGNTGLVNLLGPRFS